MMNATPMVYEILIQFRILQFDRKLSTCQDLNDNDYSLEVFFITLRFVLKTKPPRK